MASSNPRKTRRTNNGNRAVTAIECPSDESVITRPQEIAETAASSRNLPHIATLQSLFFTWYKDDLFNIKCNNRDEKATLKKLSKIIIYLKLFMPQERFPLLNARPSVESTDFTTWVDSLRQCSIEVQKNTMQFLKQHHAIKDIQKGTLWNAFKKFEAIPAHEIPSTRPDLIDSINQSS